MVLQVTLVGAFAAVVPACASGTPVVVGSDRFALGWFEIEHSTLAQGVTYDSTRGVGIGVFAGSLVLGYHEETCLRIYDDAPSAHIVSPIAEVAFGDAADEWALTFLNTTAHANKPGAAR